MDLTTLANTHKELLAAVLAAAGGQSALIELVLLPMKAKDFKVVRSQWFGYLLQHATAIAGAVYAVEAHNAGTTGGLLTWLGLMVGSGFWRRLIVSKTGNAILTWLETEYSDAEKYRALQAAQIRAVKPKTTQPAVTDSGASSSYDPTILG